MYTMKGCWIPTYSSSQLIFVATTHCQIDTQFLNRRKGNGIRMYKKYGITIWACSLWITFSQFLDNETIGKDSIIMKHRFDSEKRQYWAVMKNKFESNSYQPNPNFHLSLPLWGGIIWPSFLFVVLTIGLEDQLCILLGEAEDEILIPFSMLIQCDIKKLK